MHWGHDAAQLVEPQEELLHIADRLEALAERGMQPDIQDPLNALKTAVEEVSRAASGSWLGYQAYVYYEGLKPPPPGAHFNAEWGLMNVHSPRLGSKGKWIEFNSDDVIANIHQLAGDPDLQTARQFAVESITIFDDEKSNLESIITASLIDASDNFLSSIVSEVKKLEVLEEREILHRMNPQRQVMTRDSTALSQRFRAPPHMVVMAEIIRLNNAVAAPKELSFLARKAGSHLTRRNRRKKKDEMIGTNVFIGHGRSNVWRDLKDFVKDRLRLPYDEFNRVPVAGITNTARLAEMMDAAAIAFIILTAEDEQRDGTMHARMNAVHEVGLFQGRLGFSKAIILLEDGCEQFSNIEGLGQIRFPEGNIKAAFEEIRQVLEREGVIKDE